MFTLRKECNVNAQKVLPYRKNASSLQSSVFCIIILILLTSNVSGQYNSAKYDRNPPGVPPRQPYEKTDSGAENNNIRFHDPSEYQKAYEPQKEHMAKATKKHNENQQQVNEHQPHKHGMGQAVDAEHMKQHNKEEYVDFSKMTKAETALHHFRQFDLDNNGRVDGLEVYKKIQLDAAEHGDQEQSQEDQDILVKIVDNALEEYDMNKDGYIHYSEFYSAYNET